MNTLRIAVVQMDAGDNPARNLAKVEAILAGAGEADVVALPEVFAIRGSNGDYRAAAETLDGATVKRLRELAARRKAWILAGSVIERDGDHIYNTCALIDRGGTVTARYRKIHLFEAFLEDGRRVRETDLYEAGDTPVTADIEGWRVGLAICYDLRFPELFRALSRQGVDLFFVPSNFTQRTGKDHWEILVRARAIENQCFVVAPNQCGANPKTGVLSHGHSMAVGPWGEVLGEAGTEASLLAVELDPLRLAQTRARVPALKHRVL